MAKKTIEDIQVNGKKVLVRCDFNVPMDENKVITDENRLRGALPTIQYLIKNGAKVILCSHLGRPKGEFNMKYSLRPVAERLSQLLAEGKNLNSDQMLTPKGVRMTVTMITVIPVLCIYPFLQRYFVKGIMIGAVKA